IGYISFNHDLNMALTIRSLVMKEGTAYLQAGAGIVADSVPENEYNETLHKARSLIEANKYIEMKQFHNSTLVCQSAQSGYVLQLLISPAGGRFPRAWLHPPRSLCALRGLKAHGTALSFVPPKTICYSRWSRRLPYQSTI